jgi:two-component system, LytTR family, response regulator
MKKQYTAVIIDDEQAGITNLRNSLNEVDRIVLIGSSSDAQEAKNLIIHSKPDLIFLDVEMPEMTGFDLMSEIKDKINWPFRVIFYTAYDKYMLDALRVSAFDFLLKPYKETEFREVIDRFLKSADKEADEDNSLKSIDHFLQENPSLFLVSTIRGYRSLAIKEIGYFEYDKANRHWLVVLENQKIPLRRNASCESIVKLSPLFKQINQQQIINLNYLTSIEEKQCVLLPPFENAKNLFISRNFFKSVQDSFFLL